MRRALLIITVVIVLIAGGYISVAISKQGAALPGQRVQTENPEANVFTVTADKGAIFFIFTAIALGWHFESLVFVPILHLMRIGPFMLCGRDKPPAQPELSRGQRA